MRVKLLVSLLLVFAGTEIGQEFTHFEVASVKPAAPFQLPAGAPAGAVSPGSTTGGIGSSNPRQISYRGAWLSILIENAYGIRFFQLSGEIPNDRYDIVANIPEGATKEQFNVMLRNLLRERFNLNFHRESKVFPAYALVVGKGGVKLKESPKETEQTPSAGTNKGGLDENGFPMLPPSYSGLSAMPGNGRLRLVGQKVGIQELLNNLDGGTGTLAGIDGPIVNETGLTGKYDLKLEFEYKMPGTASDTSVTAAPTIFSAFERDLGLKLESKRVPFDMLVVDRLDKVPTEN